MFNLCEKERDFVMQDWKMVQDFEGIYWINRQGQIKNAKGQILKQYETNGMRIVTLYGSGLKQKYPVDLLILMNFPEEMKGDKNE